MIRRCRFRIGNFCREGIWLSVQRWQEKTVPSSLPVRRLPSLPAPFTWLSPMPPLLGLPFWPTPSPPAKFFVPFLWLSLMPLAMGWAMGPLGWPVPPFLFGYGENRFLGAPDPRIFFHCYYFLRKTEKDKTGWSKKEKLKSKTKSCLTDGVTSWSISFINFHKYLTGGSISWKILMNLEDFPPKFPPLEN